MGQEVVHDLSGLLLVSSEIFSNSLSSLLGHSTNSHGNSLCVCTEFSFNLLFNCWSSLLVSIFTLVLFQAIVSWGVSWIPMFPWLLLKAVESTDCRAFATWVQPSSHVTDLVDNSTLDDGLIVVNCLSSILGSLVESLSKTLELRS